MFFSEVYRGKLKIHKENETNDLLLLIFMDEWLHYANLKTF